MIPPSGRLDEFIAAYRAELAAVRRGGSDRRVELDHGRVAQRGETNSVVTFANPGTVTLSEGDEARLTIGRTIHEVVILGLNHDELAFGVPSPLRHHVDTATLELTVGFLYSAVLRRLQSIQKEGPEGFFSPKTGDQAVRTDLPALTDAPRIRAIPELNDRQAEAVRTITTNRTSFVWGPPGTGKTSTVAAAVHELCHQGHSVLLVSTTNAAVDVLTLKVASALASGGRVPAGLILRDGYPTAELADAYDGALTRDALLKSLGHDERELVPSVQAAVKQAKAQQAHFHRMGDRYATYREQWRERYVKLTDVHERLAALADAADRTALADARIVATTAHRVATGKVQRRFDAVVIDEASMINLPLTWLAAGQARRHIVIAGDFRQLGPIAHAEPSAATDSLRRSAFEESGVAEAATRHRPHAFAALTTQYRMVEPINDLVSRHFYPDSPLTVAASVASRPAQRALPALPPLVRIDLSGHQMWAGRSLGERSRYNLADAAVVAAIARAALRADTPITAERIIAISPYRAQAAILSTVLDRFASGADREPSRRLASTVHRYQGGEARTVILDLTDAYGTWVGRFFSGETLESDTSRLMNVALSRAQDQIIVIGDFGRILDAAPPRSPVHRALLRLRTVSYPLTVEELSAMAGDGAFNVYERNPAERVLGEIGGATERVVVFGHNVGSRLRPRLLRAAVSARSNGAAVRLVTSPPSGGAGDPARGAMLAWFDDMTAAGVTVDLRSSPGGYESAIVIDDAVWVGRNRPSDGILGDRPSATALRSASAALAGEALAHMERRRPRGHTGATSSCRRCGRRMAFADIFQAQYLYCPYCEPQKAPTDHGPSSATGRWHRWTDGTGLPVAGRPRVVASAIICPSCGVAIREGGRCRCSA